MTFTADAVEHSEVAESTANCSSPRRSSSGSIIEADDLNKALQQLGMRSPCGSR